MPAGELPITSHIYAGRILTCDPTQRLVEIQLLADGRRVQITTLPVAARWPMVGETWSVEFRNNTPYLCEPYPNATGTTIESIPAGDAFINSPTGVVHVLGSKDGQTDFKFDRNIVGPQFPNATGNQLMSDPIPGPTSFHGYQMKTRWIRSQYEDAQAHTLTLFRKSRDTANWEVSYPFQINIWTAYYVGSYTESLFTSGYTTIPTLTTLHTFGPNAISPALQGAEVVVGGTINYQTVTVTVPAYMEVMIEVRYGSTEISSDAFTAGGQVHFIGTTTPFIS